MVQDDEQETLIPDPRGRLRPAEIVERRVAELLRHSRVRPGKWAELSAGAARRE